MADTCAFCGEDVTGVVSARKIKTRDDNEYTICGDCEITTFTTVIKLSALGCGKRQKPG